MEGQRLVPRVSELRASRARGADQRALPASASLPAAQLCVLPCRWCACMAARTDVSVEWIRVCFCRTSWFEPSGLAAQALASAVCTVLVPVRKRVA
jgi:hypothetical protein